MGAARVAAAVALAVAAAACSSAVPGSMYGTTSYVLSRGLSSSPGGLAATAAAAAVAADCVDLVSSAADSYSLAWFLTTAAGAAFDGIVSGCGALV